eukprot:6842283-Alexandrium_andersonii.AAC.1
MPPITRRGVLNTLRNLMAILLRVLMYVAEQIISRLGFAGSGWVRVSLPRRRSMGSEAILGARWGAPRSATSAG